MAAAISSVSPEARPQRVRRVGRCSRQTAGGAFGAGGPGTDRVDHEAITPDRVVALERAAYCGLLLLGKPLVDLLEGQPEGGFEGQCRALGVLPVKLPVAELSAQLAEAGLPVAGLWLLP
jgi:hypothetical protein